MNLTQIQHVIEELPAGEQTALAAWIVDRDRRVRRPESVAMKKTPTKSASSGR